MAARGVVLSGRRAGTQRASEPSVAVPSLPEPLSERRPRLERQPTRPPGFTEGWAGAFAEKDVYNTPRLPSETAMELAAKRKQRIAGSVSSALGPLQRGAPKPPEYPLLGRRARAPRMVDGGSSYATAQREQGEMRVAVTQSARLSRKHAADALHAIEKWGGIRDSLDPSDQSDRDLLKFQTAGVHAGKTMLQILTDSLTTRRASLGENHSATKRAREKLETYLSLSLEQREQAERDAKERRRQKKLDKGFNQGRVGVAYELTAQEKEARSHAAILSTLRQVIKAKRTLGGKKITSVKRLFQLIDTDDSMTVDMIEFEEGLNRLGLGLSEAAVRGLGKALDTDGGGTIDYGEFETWMKTGEVPRAGEYDQGAFSSRRRERGGEHGQGLADSAIEAVAEFQAEEDMKRKQEKVNQERKAKEDRRKALLQEEARQRLFTQPYADLLTSWLRDEFNSGGYASTPHMLNHMFLAATARSKLESHARTDDSSVRARKQEERHGLLFRSGSRKTHGDGLGYCSDVVIEGALLQMVLQGAHTESLCAMQDHRSDGVDRWNAEESTSGASAASVGTAEAAEADKLACGSNRPAIDEDTAAARIQAMQRGKMVRKEQQVINAAATRIQSAHRGKAARKALPKIEDRHLCWSEDWYIAMQTIAEALGVPFLQSKYQHLTAQETHFCKQKFELVKQQRFEGGEGDFWKFVAAAFSNADVDSTGMLDFQSFASLCGSIFGSFGELQEATGDSLQAFFRRADADKSGKVSFAELVAVFVVDEQRSPALKNWIQTRAAASQGIA